MVSVNDDKLRAARKTRQDVRKSSTHEAKLIDVLEGIENQLEDLKAILAVAKATRR